MVSRFFSGYEVPEPSFNDLAMRGGGRERENKAGGR